MLIRDYIRAAAHLKASLSDPVVELVVLGTAEVFVKSAHGGDDLSAVRRMEQAVHIFLLGGGASVRRYRTAEKRILGGKERHLPRAHVGADIRTTAAHYVFSLFEVVHIARDKVARYARVSVNADDNVARGGHKRGVPRKRLVALGALNDLDVHKTVVGVFELFHPRVRRVGRHTVYKNDLDFFVRIVLK